jgi:ERCC4-type nuclease
LNALYSAIASLSRKARIITTRNSTETFYIIKKLYDKYNSGKKVEKSMVRVKPKEMTLREQAKFCLMGIDGIGEKTADNILHNRTLKDVANMELGKLSEIASSVSEKIYNVFREK